MKFTNYPKDTREELKQELFKYQNYAESLKYCRRIERLCRRFNHMANLTHHKNINEWAKYDVIVYEYSDDLSYDELENIVDRQRFEIFRVSAIYRKRRQELIIDISELEDEIEEFLESYSPC